MEPTATPPVAKPTPENPSLLNLSELIAAMEKEDPLNRYRSGNIASVMSSKIKDTTANGVVDFKPITPWLKAIKESKDEDKRKYAKTMLHMAMQTTDCYLDWGNETIVDTKWTDIDIVLNSNYKKCFNSRGQFDFDGTYSLFGTHDLTARKDYVVLGKVYQFFYKNILDLTTWDYKDDTVVPIVVPANKEKHLFKFDLKEIKEGITNARALLSNAKVYLSPVGQHLLIDRAGDGAVVPSSFSNNSSNLMFFSKKGAFDKEQEGQVYFGLEIELEFDSRAITNLRQIEIDVALNPALKGYMFAKGDGSLTNGIEFVTAPATYEVHREKLKEFYGMPIIASSYLKASDTEQGSINTGLHIHINRKAFTDETFGKFAKFLSGNADNMSFLKLISRRTTNRELQFCGFNGLDYVRAAKIHKDKARQGEKYSIVNTNHEHSYEVRLFAGAGKYESAMLSLDFMWGVYRFVSVQGRYKLSSGDFIKWLERWAPRKSNELTHLVDYLVGKANATLKPTKVKEMKEQTLCTGYQEDGTPIIETSTVEVDVEVPPAFIGLDKVYDVLLASEMIVPETNNDAIKTQRNNDKEHEKRAALILETKRGRIGHVPTQYLPIFSMIQKDAQASQDKPDKPFMFYDTGVYYTYDELSLLLIKDNQFITDNIYFQNDKRTLSQGVHGAYFLVTVNNEQNKEYVVEPLTNPMILRR